MVRRRTMGGFRARALPSPDDFGFQLQRRLLEPCHQISPYSDGHYQVDGKPLDFFISAATVLMRDTCGKHQAPAYPASSCPTIRLLLASVTSMPPTFSPPATATTGTQSTPIKGWPMAWNWTCPCGASTAQLFFQPSARVTSCHRTLWTPAGKRRSWTSWLAQVAFRRRAGSIGPCGCLCRTARPAKSVP